MEKYKKVMAEDKQLLGVVLSSEFSELYGQDILHIKDDESTVIMPREEIDVIFERGDLSAYVGKKIKFKILEIKENGDILVSRKKIKEEQRDAVISELEQLGPDGKAMEIEADVIKVKDFGAYLHYKGAVLILRNKDFANDFTSVKEIVREGTKLKCKLIELSKTRRIFVTAAQKYEVSSKIDLNIFKRDQVILGTVVAVKPFGVFVRIAPGVDALCPIPLSYDPKEDDHVQFRILQVNVETRRVRGKIIRRVQDDVLDTFTME